MSIIAVLVSFKFVVDTGMHIARQKHWSELDTLRRKNREMHVYRMDNVNSSTTTYSRKSVNPSTTTEDEHAVLSTTWEESAVLLTNLL